MSRFRCAECGTELNAGKYTTDVDYNGDIILDVEVSVCPVCTTAAYNEGKEDAHNG